MDRSVPRMGDRGMERLRDWTEIPQLVGLGHEPRLCGPRAPPFTTARHCLPPRTVVAANKVPGARTNRQEGIKIPTPPETQGTES